MMANQPANERPGYSVRGKVIAISVIGLAVVGIVLHNNSKAPPAEAVAMPTCQTDWSVCADNADMANNYSGWNHARTQCRVAAKEAAKYGTPEFSWVTGFSTFRPGDDYKSGTATVIDKDGQYSNGYGAMVHARTTCIYDLREQRVLDIKIEAGQ